MNVRSRCVRTRVNSSKRRTVGAATTGAEITQATAVIRAVTRTVRCAPVNAGEVVGRKGSGPVNAAAGSCGQSARQNGSAGR